MMKRIIHKGRERLIRGSLTDFYQLPNEIQENFKMLKKTVEKILNKSTDVYVFGSFSHGFWDEESDYDILIISEEKPDLQGKLREITNLKVDVMFLPTEIGLISIP